MRLEIHAFEGAIFLTMLCMGILGVFVLVPIACIQWGWNSVMASWGLLPLINGWQAALLYLAVATWVYLNGVIRIEFEAENID